MNCDVGAKHPHNTSGKIGGPCGCFAPTQMRAEQAVTGVQELMLHWVDTDEMEGLQLLGEEVLPKIH